MSTELGPYSAEVDAFACPSCPLRSLSEEELAEFAQGEEPAYAIEALKDARLIAAGKLGIGESGLLPALDHMYNEVPFSADGVDYARLADRVYGQIDLKNNRVTYNQGWPDEEQVVTPEAQFPVHAQAILGCLRRAKNGRCKSSLLNRA